MITHFRASCFMTAILENDTRKSSRLLPFYLCSVSLYLSTVLLGFDYSFRTEPVSSTVRNVTRPGICYDIPAHLVIEVLISEAGMRYGEPQMEISGLKIRCL